jgi:hypothetical protein
MNETRKHFDRLRLLDDPELDFALIIFAPRKR